MIKTLEGLKIGYCLTGSFCTFEKSFAVLAQLVSVKADVTAITSFSAASIDTRFGRAEDNLRRLEKLTDKPVIKTIEAAEPIGPKALFDILIVAPCTANTLAKLAVGIADTPVTMAVKSHLRNLSPVLIAVSTNDGLAAASKNIGLLENTKNYYFVPFAQDDYIHKPRSVMARFELIPEAAISAVNGRQLQPILFQGSEGRS